eukprot:684060-Hanusia_phi.AAC.1
MFLHLSSPSAPPFPPPSFPLLLSSCPSLIALSLQPVESTDENRFRRLAHGSGVSLAPFIFSSSPSPPVRPWRHRGGNSRKLWPRQ